MVIIGLFGIYGLYIGMTEGIEKAFLADMAPSDQKASIFDLWTACIGSRNITVACIDNRRFSLGHFWLSRSILVWRRNGTFRGGCALGWSKKTVKTTRLTGGLDYHYSAVDRNISL